MVDDGIERSWQEAREFCFDEYGTDLATFTDVCDDDFQCAVRNLNVSSWTGIHSPYLPNATYCYEFTDGECPELDTCECVGNDSWLDGQPLSSTEASQCVRYIPIYEKIQNDVFCGEKLESVVCNNEGNLTQLPFICGEECNEGWAIETCWPPKQALCGCDSSGTPESSCIDPVP